MHQRHPLTELPQVSPPQHPDRVTDDAAEAVADLKERYAAATGFLRDRFKAAAAKAEGGGGQVLAGLSAQAGAEAILKLLREEGVVR